MHTVRHILSFKALSTFKKKSWLSMENFRSTDGRTFLHFQKLLFIKHNIGFGIFSIYSLNKIKIFKTVKFIRHLSIILADVQLDWIQFEPSPLLNVSAQFMCKYNFFYGFMFIPDVIYFFQSKPACMHVSSASVLLLLQNFWLKSATHLKLSYLSMINFSFRLRFLSHHWLIVINLVYKITFRGVINQCGFCLTEGYHPSPIQHQTSSFTAAKPSHKVGSYRSIF